jgi:hypothetical protein
VYIYFISAPIPSLYLALGKICHHVAFGKEQASTEFYRGVKDKVVSIASAVVVRDAEIAGKLKLSLRQ